MMPKISVIVPFFGVEKYIERCAVSILEQTWQDLELIFVDDCSRDRSAALLGEVLGRYPNLPFEVMRLAHPVNRGISAARQTGMAAATGEYLLFVDSDDHLDRRMVEQLVLRAMASGADVVYCDYAEVRDGIATPVSQRLTVSTPKQIAAAMLRQEIKWAPWNKLVRRQLLIDRGIAWPAGINVGEDLVVMAQSFCCARSIAYVGEPLYFYNRDNVHSALRTWSAKSCRQNLEAVEMACRSLGDCGDDPDLAGAVCDVKLMARYQMLYTLDASLVSDIAGTFPETNSRVISYVPAPWRWRLAMQLVAWQVPVLSSLALRMLRSIRRLRRGG